MKKLLLSSAVLLMFSVSILLFQVSCQKIVSAQDNKNLVTENISKSVADTALIKKVIFKKIVLINGVYTTQIWMVNYDGTNATRINIHLPSGINFSDDMNPVISPDGSKIFFTAGTDRFKGDLYACNSNGSNAKKIINKGDPNNNIILGSAN